MADYFFKSIRYLHQHEEIMLYDNLLQISADEEKQVGLFLAVVYEQEATSYPYQPPDFEREAALWAAKTIYIASQLMLYRENKEADIPHLLPVFSGKITAAAILSADLSLRFLPDIITQLKIIAPEDRLIEWLENLLQVWHYSGINYQLLTENLDFQLIAANDCLYQLYLNRVTEYKNTKLASHPALAEGIRANMGIYAKTFWKELKIETP